MNPIVFLDIDGVLNVHDHDTESGSNTIHIDKMKRLNRILVEADAMVVLSSAWRYFVHRGEMTLVGLEWLFRTYGMVPGRLLDVTRPDSMVAQENWKGCAKYAEARKLWPSTDERGQQIHDWLIANGPRPYVVIDDGGFEEDGTWTDLGITAAGHPFIRVNGTVGLRDLDVMTAVRILKGD